MAINPITSGAFAPSSSPAALLSFFCSIVFRQPERLSFGRALCLYKIVYLPPDARWRKVTTCARVQPSFGEKRPALVPLVMPSELAQMTASRQNEPAETSEKSHAPLIVGEPAERCRNVTICPRVHGANGEKLVLLVPFVMPRSTAHCTAS